MSGAAQGSQNTTKAVVSDSKDTSQPLQPQKPGAQLEEDDEFEDFPVEGTHTRRSSIRATRSRKLTTHDNRLDQGRGSRLADRRDAPVGGELGRRRHERRLLGAAESRAGEGGLAEEELNSLMQ